MLPIQLSVLRSLRTLFITRRRPDGPCRRVAPLPRRVLRCEQLEDRTVPAGVVHTVSFAAPTDVAGTTDLVTVVVTDTSGNPIGGLTNSDFALALSGGTSTGTFGPVTEIGTSDTYATLFTGNTAGTTSTLTVSIDGTPSTNRSMVQVTPGAVSAANSTANFATPSILVGSNDDLTIRVRDAAGNAITGLSGGAFQLGLSLISGYGGGTFGPVSETTTPGTYTTTFTGRAGYALPLKLTVSVAGTQLNSHATVMVSDVDPSGYNQDPAPLGGLPFQRGGGIAVGQFVVTAQFTSPTVVSGTTDPVTIVVANTDGSAVSGLLNADFTLTPSGGTSTGTFGPVSETATPGTYTTQFTGKTAGTPTSLSVSAGLVTVSSQPTVQVTAGPVSAATSTARFATPSVATGAGDVVALSAFDGAGNAVTVLAGGSFALSLTGGTSTGAFGPVSEMGTSGVYTTTFTGSAVGTPSTLIATVGGAQLSSQPTVQVTQFVTPPPMPPPAPAAPPAAAPAAAAAPPTPVPVYSGVFMFGNLMVLAGSAFKGGFLLVPLPPGSLAFFIDTNGDGHGDVVLFVPHMTFVLDGLTGALILYF